jgi:AcrR family transcriptional regulator
MLRTVSLLPAPGRGQYDRRLPRELRLAEQRERLLAAVAQAHARQPAPALGAIVALAGVGRNTFYEYFDDIPHARREAESAVLRRVDAKLRVAEQSARTPVERFRAVARAWLDAIAAEPAEALLMLTPAGVKTSRGAELLRAAFERVRVTQLAAGMGGAIDPVRSLAVAATGEALARTLVAQWLEPANATTAGDAASAERDAMLRGFVDVAVRLLR